jgi:valyl-tRNA synthetase
MELASKYNPAEVEGKWYKYWMDNNLFASKPDDREPYCIVIPPPNVTGVLHMGHMLNNTIQDILVRRARMLGKNACWVPGTDHASIATEAKVVNKLAAEGIKKTDLSREEFLKHAWQWTDKHGGIILEQLKKLGASCDWDRTCFTMDEVRSESVLKVFVDLFEKGLIYRGVRMVNWDPKALTALSDEEVIFKEQQGKLYYLRYKIVGEEGYAVVATTRPETILGDTAMCINPNDEKNAHLRGKKVIVPLVNRIIPVIQDDYVDIDFGTGCLKVTPEHDVNDYALGQKYNLPGINIFNDDATVNDSWEEENSAEVTRTYLGQDRFDLRKQIEKDLIEADLMEKVEAYTNKVGFSERTDVPIEPKLSMQWFLKMEQLAKPALDSVMNDDIKLVPAKFKNTYRHWMENVNDWCISRQLWWGHQIPVWYYPSQIGSDIDPFTLTREYFVEENEAKAKAKIKAYYQEKNYSEKDIEIALDEKVRQDEDCLDTWFSSWLWPISVFDGINNPENEEIKYYYPTNDLVTGPDILFFWVARMIISGYEYRNEMPFENVYLTGIVRDKLGRKMSKSLGNSPEPLELIETFGADGVRMGMMLAAPAGNDIHFDEALCEQGRNFNNKIWNAFRLVKGWEVDAALAQPESAAIAIKWFDALLNRTIADVNDSMDKYRISEALMEIYKLFWDEFSSWYLEMVKPAYQQPIDKATYEATLGFFDALLKLLHPYMPFITEELWQATYERAEGESLMTQLLPEAKSFDAALIADVEIAKEIITGVRNVRAQKNIPNKEAVELEILGDHNANNNPLILKLSNLSGLNVVSENSTGAVSFLVGTSEYAVPLGNLLNVEEELKKLNEELVYQQGFLVSVQRKLSNEKFVANAKPEVVDAERKKQSDAESKIKSIEENIAALQK